MAKELPYFKFEPAEYLTKDVSFCSLGAQGLFVNICCYYWQRCCKLSKEQILRRFNHVDELNELISEGVIDLKGNNIAIKFLDAQFAEISGQKSVSSDKGKIGNLKRWHKDIYDRFMNKEISLKEAVNIAKLSPPDKLAIAKTSQIREEENRYKKSEPKKDTAPKVATPISERKVIFKKRISESLTNELRSKYSQNMLKDFFEYWTEHGPNDKKMRFEKQKSFDVTRRLSTWYRREILYNKEKKTGAI